MPNDDNGEPVELPPADDLDHEAQVTDAEPVPLTPVELYDAQPSES